MTLIEFLDRYIEEHDLREATIKGYRTALNSITAWHGRPIELDEMNDELMNRYLTWSLANAKSRVTSKTRRSQILTIVRYAEELQLISYVPRRVKPIKTPANLIDIWSVDEMRDLLRAARETAGVFIGSRVEKSKYFEAIFSVAWDTALRRGDLVRIEREWVENGNIFSIVQQKSGSQKVCQINESTRQLILSMSHDSEFAFPKFVGVDRISRIAKEIMTRAGLRSPRGQIFHKIRRSSITHIEGVEKGCGWLHGGHSDMKITQKHYINAEAAYANLPVPADLAG